MNELELLEMIAKNDLRLIDKDHYQVILELSDDDILTAREDAVDGRMLVDFINPSIEVINKGLSVRIQADHSNEVYNFFKMVPVSYPGFEV